MKHRILTLLIASLLGVASAATAADIDVMTQNQYLGADIAPLIATISDPVAFNTELGAALQQIAANKTPDRIQSLAGEVLRRRPHLVGLQEVWQFACIPAGPTPAPCNDARIAGAFQDHLALTEAALDPAYNTVAVVDNFKVDSFPIQNPANPTQLILVPGIPFALDGLPFQPGVPTAFLQVLDRDVIVARADVEAAPYSYSCTDVSVDGCNYADGLFIGPLGAVKRGFVAVNAKVGTAKYRFVNTHLEVEGLRNFNGNVPLEPLQSLQAQELVDVIDEGLDDRKLILVGDMNSSPDDPALGADTPYTIFSEKGLFDAWLLRPGNVAGLSCCQLEDLSNRVSILSRRIDLIYSQEMPRRVKDARLIGEVAADRLAPPGRGLWPSDHSSVAAELQY